MIRTERVMSRFDLLTSFIEPLESEEFQKLGQIPAERRRDNMHYRAVVSDLEETITNLPEMFPEYNLINYPAVLEEKGLNWGEESMREADVSGLDAKYVLALLIGSVRAGRYIYLIFEDFIKEGIIQKWLKRLEELEG